MNARTPDVTFIGGADPTHRCRVCGALWRLWDDGEWNLRSKECGSCCDNVVMGDQIEELGQGAKCFGAEPVVEVDPVTGERVEHVLEPADELEWLREQYVVLKQNNDSLRQAYSAVGQEASALRRAMASRQPTLRERAALVVLPFELNMAQIELNKSRAAVSWDDCLAAAIMHTVRIADALVKELANG